MPWLLHWKKRELEGKGQRECHCEAARSLCEVCQWKRLLLSFPRLRSVGRGDALPSSMVPSSSWTWSSHRTLSKDAGSEVLPSAEPGVTRWGSHGWKPSNWRPAGGPANQDSECHLHYECQLLLPPFPWQCSVIEWLLEQAIQSVYFPLISQSNVNWWESGEERKGRGLLRAGMSHPGPFYLVVSLLHPNAGTQRFLC